MRITRAGTPAATAPAGTSPRTTAPAPMIEHRLQVDARKDDRIGADIGACLDADRPHLQVRGDDRELLRQSGMIRADDARPRADAHVVADLKVAAVDESLWPDPNSLSDAALPVMAALPKIVPSPMLVPLPIENVAASRSVTLRPMATPSRRASRRVSAKRSAAWSRRSRSSRRQSGRTTQRAQPGLVFAAGDRRTRVQSAGRPRPHGMRDEGAQAWLWRSGAGSSPVCSCLGPAGLYRGHPG